MIDEASSSIGLQTYSTMQRLTFSSINVISKPFEISKDCLRQNFNQMENYVKREWFLSHFDLNVQSFRRHEWFSFIERHKDNVPLFSWWAILFWWVMMMLTCWIACFDELHWYPDELSWIVNLYDSLDHNCLDGHIGINKATKDCKYAML